MGNRSWKTLQNYNIIMLSIAERHKHILDKLNAQGFVKVLDIARELDLQEVTIKLHIRGICRKLGANNRTQAALKAYELGLVKKV